MDETFFINFDGYKNEAGYVSISKTRVWPSLLAASQWICKSPIPANNLIQSGVGILLINNLAISVEGLVTDILVAKLDNNEEIKPTEVTRVQDETWRYKRQLFNLTFPKKIEEYAEYEAIKILFTLRNNISHGRSHSEMSKTDGSSEEFTNLESTDINYQMVRAFFIKKKLLKDSSTSSNTETLWKFDIVSFLIFEAKKFMFSILKDNDCPAFIGIKNELDYVNQL